MLRPQPNIAGSGEEGTLEDFIGQFALRDATAIKPPTAKPRTMLASDLAPISRSRA